MQVSPARLGGDFFLADCINAVNATLVTAPIIAARLGPSAASPLLLNGLGHASIHETTCLLLVIRAKGVLANWNLQAPLEYHRVTPSSHSMMIKLTEMGGCICLTSFLSAANAQLSSTSWLLLRSPVAVTRLGLPDPPWCDRHLSMPLDSIGSNPAAITACF